jgi:hypothetical protein
MGLPSPCDAKAEARHKARVTAKLNALAYGWLKADKSGVSLQDSLVNLLRRVQMGRATPGGWTRMVNADDVGGARGVRFGARPSERDMANRLREMEGKR